MVKSYCFFLLFSILVLVNHSVAQQNVSISDVNSTPDASSVLDVSSATKGLLIPRLALTATNAGAPITLPATSLLVYNTATAGVAPNNVTPGYYYNSGTPVAPIWFRIYAGPPAGTEWKLLGNAGTVAATNFLGTTDAIDLVFRTNNLERARILSTGNFGIGTTSPAEQLHGTGNMRADGIVYWGNGLVRTESRGDAGLRGDAGAKSGFYETSAPSPGANWPVGAASWWHLIDTRHSTNGNNYAMQFAGSFYDQNLFFRKTNDNAAQPWSRVLTTNDATKVTSVFLTNNVQIVGNNTGTYANNAGRGWTFGTWQDVPSMTVTSIIPTSKKVIVNVAIDGYGNDFNFWAPQAVVFRILRDNAVQVGKTEVLSNESVYYYYYWNANFTSVEFTGDGASHTWRVQYWITNSTASTESAFLEDRSIAIIEATQP